MDGVSKKDKEFKYEYEMFAIKVRAKIGYYRRVSGMTQQELAAATGFSDVYIGQLEGKNSRHAPSLKAILKLSRALGVKPYKFLDVEND